MYELSFNKRFDIFIESSSITEPIIVHTNEPSTLREVASKDVFVLFSLIVNALQLRMGLIRFAILNLVTDWLLSKMKLYILWFYFMHSNMHPLSDWNLHLMHQCGEVCCCHAIKRVFFIWMTILSLYSPLQWSWLCLIILHPITNVWLILIRHQL